MGTIKDSTIVAVSGVTKAETETAETETAETVSETAIKKSLDSVVSPKLSYPEFKETSKIDKNKFTSIYELEFETDDLYFRVGSFIGFIKDFRYDKISSIKIPHSQVQSLALNGDLFFSLETSLGEYISFGLPTLTSFDDLRKYSVSESYSKNNFERDSRRSSGLVDSELVKIIDLKSENKDGKVSSIYEQTADYFSTGTMININYRVGDIDKARTINVFIPASYDKLPKLVDELKKIVSTYKNRDFLVEMRNLFSKSHLYFNEEELDTKK